MRLATFRFRQFFDMVAAFGEATGQYVGSNPCDAFHALSGEPGRQHARVCLVLSAI